MKQKKIFLLFFAFALIFGMYSCKKESFNINQNPNNATDSTVAYNVILPAAQNSTASLVARNWGWLQNYLGYWSRSGTYAPNTEEETYQLTTNFQSGIWSGVYDNLYDYQTMQISASKAGATFFSGIARIMKAHDFAMLVDLYGNIPYSQALKGTAVTTPRYDNGVDVSKDLLRQIDTAIAEIANADESTTGPNSTIAANDIMFGNKNFSGTTIAAMKTRWAQFGNTLKLRILTKFMNGGVESNTNGTIGTPASYAVPEATIQAEFAIIAAEGSGYLDFDAQVQPGYQSDKGNPFYNTYVADNAGTATGNSVYYKANIYAVGDQTANIPGYYTFDGDTRAGEFYTKVSNKFRGVQYGLLPVTSNGASTLSGIGAGVTRGVDQPQWILTAAESYFLQAECANRGFISGDAAALMNQGIYASYESFGLTGADAQTYIDFNAGYPDVDYAAAEAVADGAVGGLFTIISQKWFALNAIAPYEVWSDYRRVDISSSVNHFSYGSPVGFDPGPPISVAPANTRTELPVRLLYPQNEYLYNAANVGAQPSAGSYPFTHIFWDLN
jgi:hypothetical protein